MACINVAVIACAYIHVSFCVKSSYDVRKTRARASEKESHIEKNSQSSYIDIIWSSSVHLRVFTVSQTPTDRQLAGLWW